ncbi:MAG: YciI family protein [Gemmatimonadales bacterium]
MNRPTDEELLAFLEGELDPERQTALLDRVEADPALAAELRAAAVGWASAESLRVGRDPLAPPGGRAPRRVSPWWVAAAAAAAIAITAPLAWRAAEQAGAPPTDLRTEPLQPVASRPESGFVLVLEGRWPDAATVAATERQRRAAEYWAWADSLEAESVLIAAGDLRWEAGSKLGPDAVPVSVSERVVESPEFLVGMYALRATSYQEAVAIASACPHLRYGGSVSVRRLATGFLTAPRPRS